MDIQIHVPDVFYGYFHHTVNHMCNFVDPDTAYHLQRVERVWIDCKSFMKNARGAGLYLQAHLDEWCISS